jgi:hypothetical protein
MKRLALPLACLALLSACETTSGPPVGPMETQLEAGRYRIGFRGPSGVSAEEAQDRALLDAANLAVRQGYDWMRVTGRRVDVAPPTSPRISFGIGGASFGRNSAVGFGTSQGFGGEVSFVASLEAQFGRGPKPSDPAVYDAHGVQASLGPQLNPPPPPPPPPPR